MEESCHTIDHRVYYNETDQMGRVYHSNYVLWMEKGRTEFIRDKNISYAAGLIHGHHLEAFEERCRAGAPLVSFLCNSLSLSF